MAALGGGSATQLTITADRAYRQCVKPRGVNGAAIGVVDVEGWLPYDSTHHLLPSHPHHRARAELLMHRWDLGGSTEMSDGLPQGRQCWRAGYYRGTYFLISFLVRCPLTHP